MWNKPIKFHNKIPSGCQQNSKTTLGDCFWTHLVMVKICQKIFFESRMWTYPVMISSFSWLQKCISFTCRSKMNNSALSQRTISPVSAQSACYYATIFAADFVNTSVFVGQYPKPGHTTGWQLCSYYMPTFLLYLKYLTIKICVCALVMKDFHWNACGAILATIEWDVTLTVTRW